MCLGKITANTGIFDRAATVRVGEKIPATGSLTVAALQGYFVLAVVY
jgi:hypothetical protein